MFMETIRPDKKKALKLM